MKVLVVVDNLETGGVARVVNNFRMLLSNDIVFDFITYVEPSKEYRKELIKKNSSIFIVKRVTRTTPLKYIKQIKKIANENGPYQAIHIHTSYFIWLAALAAKQCNIKYIVGHAHGSQWLKTNFYVKTIEHIGRVLNSKYCTSCLSCSTKSGEYTFKNEFDFIPNVIHLENSFFTNDYNYLYDELNIKDKIIIGYLGMFSNVKNTKFILEIANYYMNSNNNKYHFVLAGNGIDFNETVNEAKLNGLNNITFLGYRNDTNELLRFFDMLIVPSLSEGMSLSILESQLLGTPVIASLGVPTTNDLHDNLFRKVSTYEVKDWVDMIKNAPQSKKMTKKNAIDVLKKIGYDDETVKYKLMKAYGVDYEH